MSRDDLLPQRSREAAIEILSLLDRISRLTTQALSAARRSELEDVQRLVDRRQVLFTEAAEHVQSLAGHGSRSADAEGAAFTRMLARIGVAAREVQRENEALAACLARQRDEVTEEIEKSNSAVLARVAYCPSSHRPRFDLTH